MPNSSPAVMKQFHDLSFLATWFGKERWADTQSCFNSTVCSECRQKLKLSQFLINRAPRRHMGERRYKWHKYSLPWSASRPSRFIPDTQCTVDWARPRARLDKALAQSAGCPTCWAVTISTELSRIQKFATYGNEHNCLAFS